VPLCVVIEDQELQRRALVATLREGGYQVVESGTGFDGLAEVCTHMPEAILLDLGLPDGDGIDRIPDLLKASPLSRIVVLTGQDSVAVAVAALRAGARHYLVKPWDRDELLLVLEREISSLNLEVARRRESDDDVFWGRHPVMDRIRLNLDQLASAPWTQVLICGETGTGKEVVARELHRVTDPRGAFVALNCAAVPSELMESELFGHERGAFTGAESRRRGVVELAHEGTLFLDEIGEMAPHLQAKLLRFLQDGTYRRVGNEVETSSRARVVAATHAELETEREAGRFRADLFYRLSVVQLELPPLRKRGEDLLPLAHFLLGRIARELGRARQPLSARCEEAMLRHGWPGNVRELANRLERAMVLGSGPPIEPEDLDLVPSEDTGLRATDGILSDPARLRHILEEEGWNLSKVARRLRVERYRVKYRVAKLGLSRPAKK